MNFNEAYEIAKNECCGIQVATARVINAMTYGGSTPCYFFAIGNEVFYFGFDGVDLHKGKHNAKKSAEIINSGLAWQVRN